jgi:hypothetical protein
MFDKDRFRDSMDACLPAGAGPRRLQHIAAYNTLGIIAESVDMTAESPASFDVDFRSLASQALERTITNPHIRASILATAVQGAPIFRYSDEIQ